MRIDPLLTSYPTRIRQVAVCVVIGVSMVFYVFPRALGEAEKIEFIIQEDIEMLDIPITKPPEKNEAPPKPAIPVASDEDFEDEDYDLFETDFEEWKDFDATTDLPEPNDDDVSPFSADYQAPKNIVPIQPIYPEIQKSMGVEGKVFVKFWVDKRGNVDPNKITIIKGVVGLNEAAIDAVKRSRWKPAMQRDRKVGVYMTVPVNFILKDN